MAVNPATGDVWLQENGDDSFSEINRIEPGLNGGWVQIAGPVARIAQFKEIETTFGGQNLRQLRWPPTNIADTPDEALSRLFMLSGPGTAIPNSAGNGRWLRAASASSSELLSMPIEPNHLIHVMPWTLTKLGEGRTA